MLAKLDLKQDLKALYQPTTKAFAFIDVPPMQFLMIDGKGNPNTADEYKQAVQALYTIAYTLKFAIKKAEQIDYPVMALEGLWWADDMSQFSVQRKEEWLWTMMIMQPDVVTSGHFAAAREEIKRKGKDSAAMERLRLETFHEGLSVQIMHIGPYADEAPTLAKLHHEFIPSQGYKMRGKHHEIYLSDPSRTPESKWKTVLRQPVER